MTLTRFIDGPQHGRIAEASGELPVLIQEEPRPEQLFDAPKRDAIWNDERQWYEVSGASPNVCEPDQEEQR